MLNCNIQQFASCKEKVLDEVWLQLEQALHMVENVEDVPEYWSSEISDITMTQAILFTQLVYIQYCPNLLVISFDSVKISLHNVKDFIIPLRMPACGIHLTTLK